MIEALVLSLALSCGAAEPPYPTPFIQAALNVYRELDDREMVVPSNHPLASLYGTDRLAFPTEPVEKFSDGITYDVWTDPIYDEPCFSDYVDSVLLDDRSWPGLSRAKPGETPQFWVTLTSPAGACGTHENPRASCAWNNKDGTGTISINAMRWVRGHGWNLEADRIKLLNHEVGHILGFGHYECSVMGGQPWRPGAGYPRYNNEWDDCGRLPSWPSHSEREAAQRVYTERWLWGGEDNYEWSGPPFTSMFLRDP